MSHDYSHRRARETLGPANQNVSNIPMPQSAVKRSNSAAGFHPSVQTASGQHGRSGSTARMSLAAGRPNQMGYSHASPMVTSTSVMDGAGFRPGRPAGSTITGFQLAGGSTHHSGPRKSIIPSSIGLPMSTPARHGPSGGLAALDSTARRNSMLPTRAPASYGGVSSQSTMAQSANNQMGNVSFFTVTQPPLPQPNPTGLRNPAVRSALAQEIIQYLTENGFEMDAEMAVPTFKQMTTCPPATVAAAILKWMYHRIDPSYVFPPSPLEVVFPPLLKQLRCPWERVVNRSQLQAPQPANWSSYLGLMQWLMYLAQMMGAFGAGQYDHACVDAGFDVRTDRIGFEFISNAYRDWMTAADDDDDGQLIDRHTKLLQDRFREANSENIGLVDQLKADNSQWMQRMAEEQAGLDEQQHRLDNLVKTVEVLTDDKGKFVEYIDKLEPRVARFRHRVLILTEQIEGLSEEVAAADNEHRQLQGAVAKLGLSVADLDRKAADRERLQKTVDSIRAKLEDVEARVADTEATADDQLDRLEIEVEQFNSLGRRTRVIPSGAENSYGFEFELELDVYGDGEAAKDGHDRPDGPSDRLVGPRGTGHHPHTILNRDVRATLGTDLAEVRARVMDRRRSARDGDMAVQEKLHAIQATVRDKESEIASLKYRVGTARDEYETVQQVTAGQKNSSTAQIETMEQKLATLRQSLDSSIAVAEQHEMAARLEYEHVRDTARKIEDDLHSDLGRLVDEVVSWKIHIQKSLAEYEMFIADIVEDEWAVEMRDDEGMDGDEWAEAEAQGRLDDSDDLTLAASAQRRLKIRGQS